MSKHQPEDLENARTFLAEVSQELSIDPQVIEKAMPHLLGLTKHVAHDVVRPAAPLAAFLVGIASANGDEETVRANIDRIEALIKERNLELEENAD